MKSQGERHQGEYATAFITLDGFDLVSYHVKRTPEGSEHDARH